MPIVRATLIRGYSEDVRIRLAERLSDAVAATIKAPMDAITVMLDEVEPANYMRGRANRSAGEAQHPASEIVVEFLRQMERRELDAARQNLAPDFQMVFPGVRHGTQMTDLEQLVAFSAQRYRFVLKDISAVDECFQGGKTTVYVSGTLSGETPDGKAFDGVRFIDRFELEGGKIRKQQVWNDLAIALAALNSDAA